MDPAEALWEAAAATPTGRPVLVRGYAQLGRDEVAFADDTDDDGSIVHLPRADDRLFAENVGIAKALRQRARTVDYDPASLPKQQPR